MFTQIQHLAAHQRPQLHAGRGRRPSREIMLASRRVARRLRIRDGR